MRVILILALLTLLAWPAWSKDLAMTDQGRQGAELLLANNGYQVKVFRGVFEQVDPETLSYTAHVSGLADNGLLCDAWIEVEHGAAKAVTIKMVTEFLTL